MNPSQNQALQSPEGFIPVEDAAPKMPSSRKDPASKTAPSSDGSGEGTACHSCNINPGFGSLLFTSRVLEKRRAQGGTTAGNGTAVTPIAKTCALAGVADAHGGEKGMLSIHPLDEKKTFTTDSDSGSMAGADHEFGSTPPVTPRTLEQPIHGRGKWNSLNLAEASLSVTRETAWQEAPDVPLTIVSKRQEQVYRVTLAALGAVVDRGKADWKPFADKYKARTDGPVYGRKGRDVQELYKSTE